MQNKKIIKSVELKEIERKFTILDFEKKDNWDREFIIFQWFIENSENKETKLKLIIDMHSFVKTYARITKERISNKEANKKVDYLNSQAINFKDLIGQPFIGKRRSVKNKIHLDKFLFSNGVCRFLLEDEGNHLTLENFCSDNQITIVNEVTEYVDYRNINMATEFKIDHFETLETIQKLF